MLPLAASVPINPAKLVLTSDISAQANEAVCAKWMGCYYGNGSQMITITWITTSLSLLL